MAEAVLDRTISPPIIEEATQIAAAAFSRPDSLLFTDPNNILGLMPWAISGVGGRRFTSQHDGSWEVQGYGLYLKTKGRSAEGYSDRILGESQKDFYWTSDAVYASEVKHDTELVARYNYLSKLGPLSSERVVLAEQLLVMIEPWYDAMTKLGYTHYKDLSGIKDPLKEPAAKLPAFATAA